MQSRDVLRVRGLRKSYGQTRALRGVDLAIAAGEILALLGPNGAGKTTLISIVAGLLRPDGGAVQVAGRDALAGRRQLRGLIGLAPQDLGICPEVTVQENLRFFGELAGVDGRTLRSRIDQVSEALGLTPFLRRSASVLSTGQKRRLHTALALLHRPLLLLLDEPTVGADVHARLAILEVVRELARGGSAICYSTHYLPEVEALDASVAILEEGAIIARGRVRDLVARESRATVEMTFEGTPPAVSLAGEVTVRGSVLRILTREAPAETIAAALGKLGEASGRLRGVEVMRPSLESVYLQLTGRRSVEDGDRVAS
jgi:ABC-2 type transport system ATP-binding protein